MGRRILVTGFFVATAIACGNGHDDGATAADAGVDSRDVYIGDTGLDVVDSGRQDAVEDVGVDVVEDAGDANGADVSDAGDEDTLDDTSDALEDRPSPDDQACNRHRALCDRRFDEVTLATTHNAMNNAEEGWLAPNQQFGLTRQMEDGIRGMMLDTYEWNDDLYLCHGTCLAGSQLLVDGLAEIAAFLSDNPREVMAIIFQDAILPEQTAEAFATSGLVELVYTYDGGAWPTLQEMIDADTRLVVGAEQYGPPPRWYHHAWDLWFDTPYNFASAEEFSCELNRGRSDNSLFLVNHWITVFLPQPGAAPQVNAADVLLSRARQCEDRWDRRVNLLAVDFYADGDLFEVVDVLNGVHGPGP